LSTFRVHEKYATHASRAAIGNRTYA
jgi:hypothetical protein